MKKINNQLGDTIIEVMIALMIIGFVIAGAYSLTNLSLNIETQSQQRSNATLIAQTQIEELKNFINLNNGNTAAINAFMGRSTSFCMENQKIDSNSSSCYFSQNGVQTASSNYLGYNVKITDISKIYASWNQVQINVNWNNNTNQVYLFYGFNNND